MSHDIPDWSKKETILSLKDVLAIAGVALAELVIDGVDWLDSRLADRWNGPEDES